MSKALFFFADGTLGQEPYLTNADGSDATITLDIAPGSFDSVSDEFVAVVGNKVLFQAYNEGATNPAGIELWSYDADTGVTSLLRDIEFGPNDSDPSYLVTAGNKVYFQAYTTDFGQELWVSDGTSTGTTRLTDINPNAGNGLNDELIAKFGDKALFIGDDGVSGFEELWISGGDDFSTNELVGNAIEKVFFDVMFDPIVEKYGALDSSTFYFQAESFSYGRELWVTNGESAGTIELPEINPFGDSNPMDFMALNGRMYFTADDGVNGRELWRIDPTTNAIALVKDINVAGAGFSSDPKDFKLLKTADGDRLIFSADDGVNGRELWITDGTNAGTQLVLNIDGNSGDSLETADSNELMYFALVGDGSKAVFSADDDNVGEELWITDGTTGGTMLLKEIDADDGFDSDPEDFFDTSDGLAYFSADVDGTQNGQVPTGRELWVTDGTEAGTKLVKNIQNGDNDSDPYPRAEVDVNSPPSAPTLSTSSVAENTDDGDTVGTLSSTDAENDTITYSITDDPENKFAISGNNLVVDGSLDFENDDSHSVTVQADDGNGGTSTSTFTISVTDVNENPSTPTLDGDTVAEDSAVATVVGKLSSEDPEGEDVTYSLSSDAGNRFAIQGSNVIVNDELDFESNETHSITVEATDGTNTVSQTFTINVTDVDEPDGTEATSGPDVFEGTPNADTYDGLGGADIINGKGGADDLSGSGGKDTINGNGGKDTMDGGNGKDTMNGGGGSDTMTGGNGKDTMDGGNGKDSIEGGKGKDELTGGKKADTFVFTDSAKQGKDTITDFDLSEGDVIDLSGQGLSFDDLKIKANGGDAKIVTDKGEWIQLDDVAKSDVTSEFFDFG